MERQYLADRAGLVAAVTGSGNEYTPPSLEEYLAELDEALVAEPVPTATSDRERSNQAFLRAI